MVSGGTGTQTLTVGRGEVTVELGRGSEVGRGSVVGRGSSGVTGSRVGVDTFPSPPTRPPEPPDEPPDVLPEPPPSRVPSTVSSTSPSRPPPAVPAAPSVQTYPCRRSGPRRRRGQGPGPAGGSRPAVPGGAAGPGRCARRRVHGGPQEGGGHPFDARERLEHAGQPLTQAGIQADIIRSCNRSCWSATNRSGRARSARRHPSPGRSR